MLTSEKIDEWIREAEARPESGPLLIKIIANRLRDLAIRNEELLAENIALLNGKRVEEYEQRIAHLEYQLELLRRQLGGELSAGEASTGAVLTSPGLQTRIISLLIYNYRGRVIRIDINAEEFISGEQLAHLDDNLVIDQEAPRMLAVPTTEELLAVFSSGRVVSFPVVSIQPARMNREKHYDADRDGKIVEPNAGEILVCLVPVAKLALAEFLVQTTRRGCVKKIASGMSQSILANHYIGTGVKLPADQTFDLILCAKDDRLILVSYMGYLLGLEVKRLPFSIEECMRLTSGDFVEAARVIPPDHSILVVTQIGKLIHRTDEGLEFITAGKSKGQATFSAARREQGVRVISAAAVRESDWGAALHRDGQITIHSIQDLFISGTIPTESRLLAFTHFSRV